MSGQLSLRTGVEVSKDIADMVASKSFSLRESGARLVISGWTFPCSTSRMQFKEKVDLGVLNCLNALAMIHLTYMYEEGTAVLPTQRASGSELCSLRSSVSRRL
jgi:hypothetical protein